MTKEKEFKGWFKLKPQIHRNIKKILFKERDVWWCSIGVNVGYEEDGKGEDFNRPILIIKKFNKRIFLGMSLTTKIKEKNRYYLSFDFQGKKISAILSQVRLFDANRMQEKMGSLSNKDFEKIINEFKSLL